VRLLIRRLGLLEKSEASCCGVTLAQCHALVEIGRVGQISLNELAEILCLDKSTVSRSVDNLAGAGLVVRETDPRDRRFLVLGLSAKGREVQADIEDRMTAYFAAVLSNIPPSDRDQVIRSLGLLAQAARNTLPGPSPACGRQQ